MEGQFKASAHRRGKPFEINVITKTGQTLQSLINHLLSRKWFAIIVKVLFIVVFLYF